MKCLKPRCLALGLGLLLAVSTPESPVAADLACKECHQDVIDAGGKGRVIHRPFLKQECGACHVAGQPVTPMAKKKPTVGQPMPEKIRWFRETYGISDEHWVVLSGNEVDDMLIYKTWEGASRAPLQKIDLPALGGLTSKKDDGQPPVMENVRVQDVRRGISTTATIAWNTDEFTEAQVDYGVQALTSSKSTHQFKREHQLVLSGLDRDATYSFQVTSRDLFGHAVQSAVMTFSTEKTFILPEGRQETSRRAGDVAEVRTQLFRKDGDYVIVFEADRPVSLAVGVPYVDPTAVPRKRPDLGDENRTHPMLKSETQTNIQVCDGCHVGFLKGSSSHPVNILPKSGMVIPPEYPLLADGRISCMSCHVYHGGNFEHRLVKPDKQSLCKGCHSDY